MNVETGKAETEKNESIADIVAKHIKQGKKFGVGRYNRNCIPILDLIQPGINAGDLWLNHDNILSQEDGEQYIKEDKQWYLVNNRSDPELSQIVCEIAQRINPEIIVYLAHPEEDTVYPEESPASLPYPAPLFEWW